MPNLEICSCGNRYCDGCADCERCGARVYSSECPDEPDAAILCEKCNAILQMQASAPPQGTKGGSDSDQVGPSPSPSCDACDSQRNIAKVGSTWYCAACLASADREQQRVMARELVADLKRDLAESEIPFFVHDLLWAD